jgi:hypothetical protein
MYKQSCSGTILFTPISSISNISNQYVYNWGALDSAYYPTIDIYHTVQI